MELLVVDNGSTDDSIKVVRKKFPEVEIITSDTNRGYAGGCNFSAQSAKGEYLLFLNMNMIQYNAKEKKYQKSIRFIKSLNQKDKINNILKYLYNEFEDWIFCGFYIKEGNQLEISNYYSDNIPCSPIEINGICGQSIMDNNTLIVNDVSKFKNHIICSIFFHRVQSFLPHFDHTCRSIF